MISLEKRAWHQSQVTLRQFQRSRAKHGQKTWKKNVEKNHGENDRHQVVGKKTGDSEPNLHQGDIVHHRGGHTCGFHEMGSWWRPQSAILEHQERLSRRMVGEQKHINL